MLVKTPVPNFNGIIANVDFVDGQADLKEQGKEDLQGWFKSKGFLLESKGLELADDLNTNEDLEDVLDEQSDGSGYEEYTLAELKDEAKLLKVAGYSKMTQEELIEALEAENEGE